MPNDEKNIDFTPFSAGELVSDRFRIVRTIGRGGMGVVYEAIDEKLNRRIALKTSRPGHHRQLPPEARAASEVSHFNICKVHEIHTAATSAGNVDFLTMEFVEGETLTHRIARSGPVPEPEARVIALQICEGLAQAHRQGVIHRDLKCGNVILSSTPDGRARAVITDFGLATLQFLDDEEVRGGTREYMAPELFLGERASIASDIYALGVLFHVMLSGSAPRRRSKIDYRNVPAPAPSDSTANTRTIAPIPDADWSLEIGEFPKPWKTVIARCLAIQPGARYQSANDVAIALGPRRWLLKAVAGGLAAALAGTLAYSITHPSGTQEAPVRLALLPFAIQGPAIPAGNGILEDVARQLRGQRRNFLVIPPDDSRTYQVKTPESAKATLGATHAVRSELAAAGNQISVHATVIDTVTGQVLRDLRGTYEKNDTAAIAKALTGTVTGALHLRAVVPKETISTAAYPHYVQGESLLRDQYPVPAAEEFRKAIDLDPRSALPYAGLAEALTVSFALDHDRQRLTNAAEALAKAKAVNPDSARVLMASGKLLSEQGQYEQASRDYSRAVELDPGDSDGWSQLALTYEKMNRPEDAVVTFQKAAAAQPGYYQPRLSLGNFYFGRGQYPAAEAQYREVTALAPDLYRGHSNLGAVLISQGNYLEAEQQLLQAMKLKRNLTVLTNLGAVYNLQRRPQEALPHFAEALSIGPPSLPLYSNLGYTYRHLGREREAAEAYRTGLKLAEKTLASNPRDAPPRAYLALFSTFLGDKTRGELEIAQALSLAPEDTTVMRSAALLYEFLNERAKSLEVLRSAPLNLLESLNREPDLKSLGEDAQFRELVGKRNQ